MSHYIDQKYVSIVGVKLEGFVHTNKNTWNFRCPKCGDSRKNKSKKRGYIYERKGLLFFRCHNCSASMSFGNFLKMVDPFLYQEYQMERYKSNSGGNTPQPDWHKIISKPTFPEKNKINLPTLASLPDSHTAKKYVLERKIPAEWMDRLYYANDFKAFVDEVFPGKNINLIAEEPRIVIPFFDRKQGLSGVQGRALSKTSKAKYLTSKRNEDCPKVFGLDRVDLTQNIYVLEGIFDSLFLPNAVATMDANLMSVATHVPASQCVFVPDRDVRNREIVKQVERMVNANVKVCLLPDNFPGKDLNEAIVAGMSIDELKNVVDNNVFEGLKARLQFQQWRKV